MKRNLEGLADILDDLAEGRITASEAEAMITDLIEYSDEHSRDCNCCYMTTGHHAACCPAYAGERDGR